MRTDRFLFSVLFAIIALLVVYPLGALFWGSFQSTDGGFTLDHWKAAGQTPLLWTSLWNTLLTSAGATLLALCIGVTLVILILRTDSPFRQLLKLITLVPFITPPFVGGVAWSLLADPSDGVLNLFLQSLGVPLKLNIYSGWGMIWVMGLFTAPIVYYICSSGLAGIDTSHEESARVCGLSQTRILGEITLPLLLPSIASSGLLVFMTNNVLFGVHSVIGIPADLPVLTTTIYKVLSIFPINYYHAAVLALILLLLGTLAAGLNRYLIGKRSYHTVSGRGFKPVVILSLNRFRRWVGGFALVYIFLTVLLPYGVILLRSFSPLALWQGGTLREVWSEVSLKGYLYILFENTTTRRAIVNSILLASTAATGATLLAGAVAYFDVKRPDRGTKVLEALTMAPLAVPGIVFGVALLWAYSKPPLMLYGTLTILFLAYLTHQLPTACRGTYGSLRAIHPELEQSAQVCGAGWFQRTWHITVKLARPGLMVSWLLVFIIVIRELGTSIILFSHGTEVLAAIMYNFWEEGLMQHVSSLSMLNVVLVILALWLVNRMMGQPLERLTTPQG